MATPLAGPKGGYLSGSAAAIRRDQLGFYESCARHYGSSRHSSDPIACCQSTTRTRSRSWSWPGAAKAVLILAAIASRFRLDLIPGQRIVPTPYITLRPTPGVRMRVARR